MRHGFDPQVGKIPLEEGMATHSSILAWRIPRTEKLGGLLSMGLQSWAQLHRLLCSRSRGAERWVRGAAGGAEARAGWGRGSERD